MVSHPCIIIITASRVAAGARRSAPLQRRASGGAFPGRARRQGRRAPAS